MRKWMLKSLKKMAPATLTLNPNTSISIGNVLHVKGNYSKFDRNWCRSTLVIGRKQIFYRHTDRQPLLLSKGAYKDDICFELTHSNMAFIQNICLHVNILHFWNNDVQLAVDYFPLIGDHKLKDIIESRYLNSIK